MKQLILTNSSYRYLQTGFANWLDLMGYNNAAVYGLPIHVKEFLHHLSTGQKVNQIKSLETIHVVRYYEYLKKRTNQRYKSSALSANSLNKHQQAIKLFLNYLRQSGRLSLSYPPISLEKEDDNRPVYLTQNEIKSLFEAVENTKDQKQHYILIPRDKALLTVFYCCGLRRTEAVSLNLEDINFDTNVLHVKKGKGYKERFVPIHTNNMKYLEEYAFDARMKLTTNKKQQAFFISYKHNRMAGQSMLLRLKKIQTLSDSASLRAKIIGLHTLRHSIATHLLEQGMSLEQISQFLGHSSLESTQIYTHLASEQNDID